MSFLPEQVDTALRRLNDAGHEACIVGGSVRDMHMERTPGDYDITTSALPEQTKAVFSGERVIETGLQHGTVTVILDGTPLEITTFRVDGDYTDARHPDSVRFTPSLTEDLARRDFTVNAMACDRHGKVSDPFGGRTDIAAKLIRCVGDPDTRFREDALRILRALRFASVLDFSIEADTAAALFRCKDLLQSVSAERIRDELTKLLCGKAVRRVIMEYVDVLGAVLPELLPQKGFDQHHPCHIYTALEHTAAAVESIPPDPVLRWTALLHDFGKVDCYTLDEEGHGHFYGHPERSVEMGDDILRRLKFDTASRERILLLVKYHDRTIEATVPAVKRVLRRLSPEGFDRLILVKRADNFAQGEVLRYRQKEYDTLETIAAGILNEKACFSLRDLAVNGSDLLAAGCVPGKAVGNSLEMLLNAVIDGTVPNDRTALLAFFAAQKGE